MRLAILTLLGLAACSTQPRLHRFDSPQIPDAVRDASRCAVNILTFSGEPSIVAPDGVEKVRAHLSEMEAAGELPDGQRRIAEMLLADIESSGQPRNLAVHQIASGFFAEEATLLWTCQHVIQHFTPKVGKPIEIVVFDSEERILFDSREGAEQAVVAYLGSGDKPHILRRGRDGLTTDFATIRLSRAPGGAVGRFQDAPAVDGEAVFLPCRTVRGDPGRFHPAFMSGEAVAPSGDSVRYVTRIVTLDRELGRDLLFTDVPARRGLSGGPILAPSGEIVGMTSIMFFEAASGLRASVLRRAVQ